MAKRTSLRGIVWLLRLRLAHRLKGHDWTPGDVRPLGGSWPEVDIEICTDCGLVRRARKRGD